MKQFLTFEKDIKPNTRISQVIGPTGNLSDLYVFYFNKKEHGALYRERHRQQIRDHVRALRQEEKRTVFDHYGRKCVCCGETTEEFLTIDHVNGGGRAHFRSVKGHVYRSIAKLGFPDTFRILCMNCNFGRRLDGQCPHERQP